MLKVTCEKDWMDEPSIREYETLSQFFGDCNYFFYDQVTLDMDGTIANWNKDDGWTSENDALAKILMIDELEKLLGDDEPFFVNVILAIVRGNKIRMNFSDSIFIKDMVRSKNHPIYEFVTLHEKVEI